MGIVGGLKVLRVVIEEKPTPSRDTVTFVGVR